MAKVLVDDELWSIIKPLLPRWTSSPKGGQPPKPDRLCLSGILFVLKTGIAWEDFPQEMGCCGMTLWNRLHAWMKAGVWPRLHQVLLDRLREADQIDFSRVIVDSGTVRAVAPGVGANTPARTPRTPGGAASPARSTMSSATRRAFHWPRRSRAPIATTARS